MNIQKTVHAVIWIIQQKVSEEMVISNKHTKREAINKMGRLDTD